MCVLGGGEGAITGAIKTTGLGGSWWFYHRQYVIHVGPKQEIVLKFVNTCMYQPLIV